MGLFEVGQSTMLKAEVGWLPEAVELRLTTRFRSCCCAVFLTDQWGMQLTPEMKRDRRGRLAFLPTVCVDDTPNLSPKGTIAVLDDRLLVFADIRSPATLRNLEKNPAIEIDVVDQFCRKGCQAHSRRLD